MPIGPEEVRRIARLARLHIDEGEAASLARDLERIVAHIDSLAEVELPADAESLTYFDADVTREDKSGTCLDHDDAMRAAPLHDDAFFLVPKIVDKDES